MPAIIPMEAPVANVRADQSELDQSVMSIGLIDLNSQDIQRRRPAAVQVMYGTPPLQCNQCGYRCPKSADAQKKMDSHLDWHFRQNRRMKDKAKKSHSRSWLVGEEVKYFFFSMFSFSSFFLEASLITPQNGY